MCLGFVCIVTNVLIESGDGKCLGFVCVMANVLTPCVVGKCLGCVCSDKFVDRNWEWEMPRFFVCNGKCVDRNWGREVPRFGVCSGKCVDRALGWEVPMFFYTQMRRIPNYASFVNVKIMCFRIFTYNIYANIFVASVRVFFATFY
jgi:hypothetical protein